MKGRNYYARIRSSEGGMIEKCLKTDRYDLAADLLITLRNKDLMGELKRPDLTPLPELLRDYEDEERARGKSADFLKTKMSMIRAYIKWSGAKTVQGFTSRAISRFIVEKVKNPKKPISGWGALRRHPAVHLPCHGASPA